MNRREWILYGQKQLEEEQIENASGEAWYLFSYCLNLSREDYLFGMTEEVGEGPELKKYQEMLEKRRKERVPLQYLIGTQDFMGYSFIVTPDVLIPRQDTETVLEEVIGTGIRPEKILDLCTGSGCIAISLALFFQPRICIGTDISEKALEIAKENGKRLCPMVKFMQSDLFDQIEGRFDLIISNPPYIASEECTKLMPEVREHEPLLALDGKEDGLFFYRKIIESAPRYLEEGGMLAFEIGYDQGEPVKEMMEENGFHFVTIKKDLAGLDRMVFGNK